jgi:hypothetical protein
MKKNKFVKPTKTRLKGVAGAFKPDTYIAGGKKVICSHCNGETFSKQQAMLNTRAATFFNFDWTDKSGTALICENCGLIQWFGKSPEKIEQS